MALAAPVAGPAGCRWRPAPALPCGRGPAGGSLVVCRRRSTSTTVGDSLVVRARRKQDEPDPVAAGCPVPKEQQPMVELRMLQESFQFDWATLPLPEFLLRLGGAFMTFFLTLGLPVSAATFSFSDEPVQLFASAAIGSLLITTILVLRLYIGYAHVGSRCGCACHVRARTKSHRSFVGTARAIRGVPHAAWLVMRMDACTHHIHMHALCHTRELHASRVVSRVCG